MADDFDPLPFEDALDEIDVIYKGGIAYMSIHTIDRMNMTIAQVVDEMHEQGIVDFSDETVNTLVWVMTMWQGLHDTLDLEAARHDMPDTPAELFGDIDEGNQ